MMGVDGMLMWSTVEKGKDHGERRGCEAFIARALTRESESERERA